MIHTVMATEYAEHWLVFERPILITISLKFKSMRVWIFASVQLNTAVQMEHRSETHMPEFEVLVKKSKQGTL